MADRLISNPSAILFTYRMMPSAATELLSWPVDQELKVTSLHHSCLREVSCECPPLTVRPRPHV